MSSAYPAGWYQDANYPGYERYFDGNAWTHHTRPSAAASQPTQMLPQQTAATQVYPTGFIGSVPNVPQAHAYAEQAQGQHGQPYGQAARAQKNKGARVPLIILGSVVGGFFLLTFIGVAIAGAGSDGDRSVADRPTVVSTPTPTPTAEAEEEEPAPQAVEEAPPAPPAPDGSVGNPFPAPYTATGFWGGDKYTFSARVTNADANAAVKEWNMFNDDAPAGYKYVIAEATMTGVDPGGVEPMFEQYDIELATAEGNGYDPEIIVFPEGTSSFWDGPTLYPGQSFTGLMAFIVPADATSFLFKVNGDYVLPAG